MIRVKRQYTGNYAFTEVAVNDDGETVTPVAPFVAKIYNGSGTLTSTHSSITCTAGVFSHEFDHSLFPLLDSYTIVWSGYIDGTKYEWLTDVELVGGFHFEIAELRALDRVFKDTTKYPSAYLREVRTAAEQTIEGPRAAQVAFVPRGARAKLTGTSPDLSRGYNPLVYGADYRGLQVEDFEVRELYSVSINGTALTGDEIDAITVDDNMLWRSAGVQYPAWPFGHRNITVHYEHGRDRAPMPIKRAALALAKEYLVESPIPSRATATSIGDQMFRLTIAGRDGITGMPIVDAAIKDWGRSGYGIG